MIPFLVAVAGHRHQLVMVSWRVGIWQTKSSNRAENTFNSFTRSLSGNFLLRHGGVAGFARAWTAEADVST